MNVLFVEKLLPLGRQPRSQPLYRNLTMIASIFLRTAVDSAAGSLDAALAAPRPWICVAGEI